MADDEIDFHRTRIIESKTLLDELEGGNQAGAEVFPETRAEIERLKEQALQRFASFVADWDAKDVRTFTQLLIKFEQSKAHAVTAAKPSVRPWRQKEK